MQSQQTWCDLPVYKGSRAGVCLPFNSTAKMDHPSSPSAIDRPAKRQRRVSQSAEDEPKMEHHLQKYANGTAIEPKVGHTLLGTK
jgi:hypothetical protein